jgi:hypothetical protein
LPDKDRLFSMGLHNLLTFMAGEGMTDLYQGQEAFITRLYQYHDEIPTLPLPPVRCLTMARAATYLGIGVTLLNGLQVPFIKLGRRCLYDLVDLDAWLTEYKQRGRAGRETLWLVRRKSTSGGTLASGGSISYYPAASAYAKALRPRQGRKRKPSLQN